MKLQFPITYMQDGAPSILEELPVPQAITLGQLRRCDQEITKDRIKWCIPAVATVCGLTAMQRAGLTSPDAVRHVALWVHHLDASTEVADFDAGKIRPVESLLNRAPSMQDRPLEFLAIVLQYGLGWPLEKVNSTSAADAFYMLPEVQGRFLGNSPQSTEG
jgi:hypothetical protein